MGKSNKVEKFRKKQYQLYLRSSIWKSKRREALAFHGSKCRKCEITEHLQVNHLHYKNIFNENIKEDLEILCRKCHHEYHGYNFKFTGESKKSFRKRKNRTKRKSSGVAMTMEEYYKRRGKSSTNFPQYGKYK